ncbi:MAG: serine/threonine-protein kinase [Planctomycetota bacterium]|nr:serine/threonine-protein kinase [Planctomycetota bacterium]
MAEDVTPDYVGRKFGRYLLTAKLGAGPIGAIYRAEDPFIERKVAIGLVPTTSEFYARVYEKARTLARLKHPNIVTLLDIGEQDGVLYLAMEYLEGSDLRQFAGSSHRPPPLVILRIMATIAAALHHVHQHKVVHRDIKPENIRIGPTGVPILIGFGLSATFTAKTGSSQASATAPFTSVGTPQYMSPQQARGEPLTALDDIWSFGATLYEALAGRPPTPAPRNCSAR